MTTINEAALVDALTCAKMCSMHRASWYKSVAKGKTPAEVRIGGMVRWRKSEIQDWIAAGCPPREKWEAINKGASTSIGKRG